jgi:Flp pilus assembly pilin Flp
MKEARVFHVRRFTEFRQDEAGQDMVEYSLLMTFIALAIVALLTTVGKDISNMWTSINNTVGNVAARGAS